MQTNITKRAIRKRLHYVAIKVNKYNIELQENKVSIQGKEIHMH